MQHSVENKKLVLGTSMWGWTTPKTCCFKMLDSFYAAGYRSIDIAPNYPINKDPKCFRLSESILIEWINTHKITDLNIIAKIGSVDNSGSPNVNLTPSFMWINYDYYSGTFGKNLDTLMIHWDNRESPELIEPTISVLQDWTQSNIPIGLSGINKPEMYADFIKNHPSKIVVELKHNYFTSQFDQYKPYKNKLCFLTYGANAGGVNLDNIYKHDNSITKRGVDPILFNKKLSTIKETLKTTHPNTTLTDHHLRSFLLQYVLTTPWVSGVILGPSSNLQLENSLTIFKELCNE
jgi:aryl-alcohol dehydrogenase-like predicted oxidoreductase